MIEAIVDERTVQVAMNGDDGTPTTWEIGPGPQSFIREIASAGEGLDVLRIAKSKKPPLV